MGIDWLRNWDEAAARAQRTRVVLDVHQDN